MISTLQSITYQHFLAITHCIVSYELNKLTYHQAIWRDLSMIANLLDFNETVIPVLYLDLFFGNSRLNKDSKIILPNMDRFRNSIAHLWSSFLKIF